MGEYRRIMHKLTRSLLFALALTGVASGAWADCYADYKAKQDDPLRLHYGVIRVTGDCTEASAAAQLEPRLAADGWQLLEISGLFDESGLEQRRESAGAYYLRY